MFNADVFLQLQLRLILSLTFNESIKVCTTVGSVTNFIVSINKSENNMTFLNIFTHQI